MATPSKPTGKLVHVATSVTGKAGTGKAHGVILHKAGCGGNHLGSCNV